MKNSTKSLFAFAGLAGMMLLSSCTEKQNIAGLWQGNPTRLELSGGANAMATTTLNFAPNSDSRSGNMNISSTIEIEQALPGSAENSFVDPFAASIAATASVNATYTFKEGEDDDILVNITPHSLNVVVDPDGVTFDRKILTGMMQSQVDSLSESVAAQMKAAITSAIQQEYAKYQQIEDIKVHHGDMMSCEIADRDQTFRKVD